jgi:hypothetical protein
MTTTKAKRIGFRMALAAQYVTDNPGCTKLEVSLAVGPHGSNAYGSRIVERAINAGLIVATADPNHAGWYCLYPPKEA